jgi:Holliday junction DNA helicase RuvA
MIATLTGVVAEKLSEHLVLDVQGVGYGLSMPVEDFGGLESGTRVKVYVYEHIRENAWDLYAFTRPDTKKLFEQLLDVNGVGPKMALSILNTGTADMVRQAIAGGDTKFIQTASGVGKRVAERVVVELKDKVGLVGVDLTGSGLLQAEDMLMQDEAVAALIALGFSSQDAALALKGVDTTLSTEARIKQALRVQS